MFQRSLSALNPFAALFVRGRLLLEFNFTSCCAAGTRNQLRPHRIAYCKVQADILAKDKRRVLQLCADAYKRVHIAHIHTS